MNDFENKVLEAIGIHLEMGDRAEFHYGTLFLTCADSTLRKITNDLTNIIATPIQVSPVGHEYAIDFL